MVVLPLALGLGEGAELRAPLAVAVVGGITVAMALTLFVVPVLYRLVAGEGEGRLGVGKPHSHAGSTSSRTKWRRITRGRSASSKWQATASRTMSRKV